MAFLDEWIHLHSDGAGSLVFEFTLHGTLSGTPVDLNASSVPIMEGP